jgi:hypothetical protein
MEKVYKIYSKLVLAWIAVAFTTQMYFTYLHFSGLGEKENKIAAKISKQPW